MRELKQQHLKHHPIKRRASFELGSQAVENIAAFQPEGPGTFRSAVFVTLKVPGRSRLRHIKIKTDSFILPQ